MYNIDAYTRTVSSEHNWKLERKNTQKPMRVGQHFPNTLNLNIYFPYDKGYYSIGLLICLLNMIYNIISYTPPQTTNSKLTRKRRLVSNRVFQACQFGIKRSSHGYVLEEYGRLWILHARRHAWLLYIFTHIHVNQIQRYMYTTFFKCKHFGHLHEYNLTVKTQDLKTRV